MVVSAAKQWKCIVTGGASGLGRATLQRLIKKHEAKAVILDLPSSNGKELAKEMGDDCYFCPTDVRRTCDISGGNCQCSVFQNKFHLLIFENL